MLDCTLNWCSNGWKSLILELKPKKCHFFQCSVIFLGHVLSAEGISANPKKVEKVTNWPSANQPKGITIIFGVGLILLPFYTKIHCYR